MDDYTRKRGFVTSPGNLINSVRGMAFNDKQRRELGGLDQLTTYLSTPEGDLRMSSFGDKIVVEPTIIEPMLSILKFAFLVREAMTIPGTSSFNQSFYHVTISESGALKTPITVTLTDSQNDLSLTLMYSYKNNAYVYGAPYDVGGYWMYRIYLISAATGLLMRRITPWLLTEVSLDERYAITSSGEERFIFQRSGTPDYYVYDENLDEVEVFSEDELSPPQSRIYMFPDGIKRRVVIVSGDFDNNYQLLCLTKKGNVVYGHYASQEQDTSYTTGHWVLVDSYYEWQTFSVPAAVTACIGHTLELFDRDGNFIKVLSNLDTGSSTVGYQRFELGGHEYPDYDVTYAYSTYMEGSNVIAAECDGKILVMSEGRGWQTISGSGAGISGIAVPASIKVFNETGGFYGSIPRDFNSSVTFLSGVNSYNLPWGSASKTKKH